MRPFKIFFGLAISIILFLFVAKIVFFAIIIAAFMSIIYAVFRRVKDFITYDRYGEYYMQKYNNNPRFNNNINEDVEPLFVDDISNNRRTINNIQFIEAI